MKNLSVIALSLFLSSSVLFAQAPQGINYQAAIRDGAGLIIANQATGLRLTIANTGGTVYQETHLTTTNDLGLVNLVIGNGTPTIGTFSNINWANGPYTVQVEADINGGTNYVTIGSQQLMSVPYALYAGTAGSGGAVGPSGVIVMWSGTIASIPFGWLLCDGSNGTPDLTDKFIISVTGTAENPGLSVGEYVEVGLGGATLPDRRFYKLAFIMKS